MAPAPSSGVAKKKKGRAVAAAAAGSLSSSASSTNKKRSAPAQWKAERPAKRVKGGSGGSSGYDSDQTELDANRGWDSE